MSTPISKNARQFIDLNLDFTVHPFTLDINRKFDDEAIKASVRNLIQTMNYERPFHPEIGSQVHSLLFENFTETTKNTIKKTIFDTIEKFEPRVTVIDVIVKDKPDDNGMELDIFFRINNSESPTKLSLVVKSVR